MSYKTDPGDGGKGAPPTKQKVKGRYCRIYRKPRRENKSMAMISPARVTFSGLTEDLKGHIYDAGMGYQADQFTATTKALSSYAGQKCSNPQDIRIAIESQQDASISISTSRTDIDGEVEKLLLGKDINTYAKRSQQYLQNKAKVYSVALEKCTEATRNCLEGKDIYEDIDGDSDVIRILLLIKSITYSYKSKYYSVLAIHISLRKFYTIHQSSSSLCDEYFKTVSNMRDVISHCSGVIVNRPLLADKFLKAADPEDPETPRKTRRPQPKLRQKRPIWPRRCAAR